MMVNVFFRRIVVGGSDLRFGQRQLDSRDDLRTDHQHQFTIQLYSAANDPKTANDPRPQMIPKLERK